MRLVPLLMMSLSVGPLDAARAGAGDTLTVVTLNIWNDQAEWPRRLPKIVAGLRALHPDVICLQEVLQNPALPNQARTLADSLGCQAHFTSVDDETRPKRYGNAILTRHRVRHAGGRALAPADDYRTVAHVRLDWKGRRLDVYDTHLHHTLEGSAIRETQIRDLLAFIDSTRGGGALVLAGDFNAGLEAAEMRLLEPAFLDAYATTHPGAHGAETATLNQAFGHPPRCIDHIFAAREGRPTLTPVAADILFRDAGPDSVWASDHFGVVARLVVAPQADRARGPDRAKRTGP